MAGAAAIGAGSFIVGTKGHSVLSIYLSSKRCVLTSCFSGMFNGQEHEMHQACSVFLVAMQGRFCMFFPLCLGVNVPLGRKCVCVSGQCYLCTKQFCIEQPW